MTVGTVQPILYSSFAAITVPSFLSLCWRGLGSRQVACSDALAHRLTVALDAAVSTERWANATACSDSGTFQVL